MSAMNAAQARVIDPVLTTVAQGYQNSEMVAGFLFPTVPVNLRGGNIITFGKESFMLYQSQRAPGENTKRVRFGYAGAPYALVDYSLEGMVPVEIEQEAQNSPGIDLGARAINEVQAIMSLRHEKASADIARNAANYAASNKVTLAGTDQWSDYGATSDPIDDIEAAKSAVRAATGKRPNTVVLGSVVMDKLKNHPKIVDRIKYTGRDVATAELLASLFGVERVVEGAAIYSNDAGTAFTDVWGKDVVVAYTNLASAQSGGLPSYGYTYQLSGYPQVEDPYFDRNAKSWLYPVTRSEAPVLAAASAGFLITNAVA
ncbi:major capsid protein [Hydrogenophaga sp. ANAO-22]|uniref:major capsid protein n=1 Tax=Hydrogenophaga sp. ANAO-22 TaxID=3166645 RepID=UPI0036D3C29A